MPTSERGGDNPGVSPEQSETEAADSSSGENKPGEDKPEPEPVTRAEAAGIEAALNNIAATLASPPARPKRDQVRDWLTPIFTFLSLGGIVAAFLAIYYANQTSHADDERTRYEAISAKLLDLDAVFVTHPELTPYFWENRTPEGDDTKVRTIYAIATQRADYLGYAYSELSSMGSALGDGSFKRPDGGIPKGYSEDTQVPPIKWITPKGYSDADCSAWVSWSETIVGYFRSSPAMCDTVRSSETGYDKQFVEALRKANACSGL